MLIAMSLFFYDQASELVPAGQVNRGATSATTLVTITVRDVNDNAPVFSETNYRATILENMQKDVPVAFQGNIMRVSDLDQVFSFKLNIKKGKLTGNLSFWVMQI